LDTADLSGDGRPDIVICHDYGDCMFNCGPDDGKISWLRNPTASDVDGVWERRPVADLVATHRIRLGHFTADDRAQLVAMPVVGSSAPAAPSGDGAGGVSAPVRVMMYDQPDDLLADQPWPGQELDAEHFRIIHGVVAGRFPGTPVPDRESFLVASAEGISWLGHDGHQWRHTTIGAGVAPQVSHEFPAHQFSGSGNLATGTVDGRPYGLIVAVEPFHGNTLAVYQRPEGEVTFAQPWQRREVEVYPRPDATHDAVAHHVVVADFDGDGDDEFLVAVRGPAPTQGVYYYKFDADGSVRQREQLTDGSAARIAVADYDGDGRLDFATTSYDTVGYYQVDQPRITVHTNTFAPATAASPATPATGPPGADG
jgi:hypothetical protein